MLFIDVPFSDHESLGFNSIGSKSRTRIQPPGALLSGGHGEVDAAQTRNRSGCPHGFVKQGRSQALAAAGRRNEHSPNPASMPPLHSQFPVESDHSHQV